MQFFSLSLLVALSLLVGAVQASEIPGYIGNQSFRLSDDSDLRDLTRRVQEAKSDYALADQARVQLEDQALVLERRVDALKNEMESALNDAQTLKAKKQTLEARLAQLKTDPIANEVQITEVESKIVQVEQSITEKLKLAGATKLELGSISTRADQIRRDAAVAGRRSEEARRRLAKAADLREDYYRSLIVAIQNINRDGARGGEEHGAYDGSDLSRRLGDQYGSSDGQADGYNQGTTDGQERDYRRGADQGERNGAARARIDGERDGKNEGIVSGNRTAGSREGRAAGINRAIESDASNVGTLQGKKAGLERAVKTGQIEGRNIGESETTKKLESGELSSQTISGPFAGSFSRRAPAYPGDFNGQRYSPSIFHSKEIARRAYADGYEVKYREYARYEYLRRIDGDYNQAYDADYGRYYNQAINRNYPAHFDQGIREGDARAYSRDYPILKAQAYKIAFDQTNANPNRASAEFKSSYNQSEVLSYTEKYEDIRSANFTRVEAEVFAANIAAQTEIFRQKRISEVSGIYNNNAVLQFVSAEMLDAGISGIAVLDGVFQPGEKTNHSVTLRNFGFKEASNVSVQVNGGALVKIPSIPARSLVVIKGAAETLVNTALNSTFKASLKVVSALSSNDAVEGRHFEKITSGTLKEADAKSVKVAYPLNLSGLALNGQLLKDVKNKLKVTLTNNSLREYKGELKLKLIANSQNEIITKEFASVSSLESSVSLTDAEILVSQDADIYRDLSISVRVEQNGVLLGVLEKDLSTMAKAQYKEVAKRPVIVANSDKNQDELLDALSAAGGTSKVSVLDLSLATLNATTIANGLSQKVLLIVDNDSATSVKSLNTFMGKSKSSAFVFVDDNDTGLKAALTLGSLKDAQKILLGKRVVAFSNPHRAAGVLKTSAFFQSGIKSFTQDLALAQAFTLTAPEMLVELKAKVTPANFGTPNDTIKIYSLRALAEILCINEAYDESGGIFNRDKKWPKMIEEDTTLFLHQLKNASKGDVVVSKLPFILSAIAMKDTLQQAMLDRDGMKLKIRGTTNDVLGNMEDSYKKNLKKDFKETYNKAYEVVAVHRPFFIK
jgi:hypothetical protein